MRTAAWFAVVRGTPNPIASAQPFAGAALPTAGLGFAVSASRGHSSGDDRRGGYGVCRLKKVRP
jgi:hypothetical protein